MLYLLLGCLFDRATYEARLAALTDDDGDGLSEVGGDCDDADVDVFPEAGERCNERDDDCDGVVDETEDLEGSAWYVDADGDGFGGGDSILTCDADAMGLVMEGGDCQDHDPAVFPGAAERCNEADDDCDGQIDDPAEVETRAWYADGDDDGFGTGDPIASCPDPGGASLTDGDCDDGDPEVSPAATETCNGQDDDCNGATDDAPAITWYLDRDEDGFGDDAVTYLVCTPPPGYADEGGDCDDLDADRHPGAWDECEDGADGDCDGLDTTCGVPTGDADVDDVSARFTGDAGEAYVARTVASAGDLDGDGDDELVVARGGWDDYTGKVHLVPGDPELYLGEVELDSVGAVVEGDEAYGAFGFALGTGEDVDGDGTADVAVATYGPDVVYVFAGAASLTTVDHDVADAWVQFESSLGSGTFGASVALLGDLDSDGFGEVLVGDPLLEAKGAAWLFYGEGGGGVRTTGGAVQFSSTRPDAQGGQEVAAVGDLDGDGGVEFVVAENIVTDIGDENAAYLFLDGTGRLSDGALESASTVTITAAARGDGVFTEVVGIGDFDRDGVGDLAVSAPDRDGAGVVLFVLGRTSWSSTSIDALADATWSGSAGSGLGAALAAVGDLDGNGYPDVAASTARAGDAPGDTWLLGGRAGLSGEFDASDAWLTVAGIGVEGEGGPLPGELDVNGDGWADLAGGAWNAASADGEVWLFYGAP